MKNIDLIVNSAIAAFFLLATANPAIAEDSSPTTPSNNERCYGLVKAGMNDCATATASCAGSATKDSQSDAFLLMPKGLCDKLVGGKLKPDMTTN